MQQDSPLESTILATGHKTPAQRKVTIQAAG
jgi:hypothetical protein